MRQALRHRDDELFGLLVQGVQQFFLLLGEDVEAIDVDRAHRAQTLLPDPRGRQRDPLVGVGETVPRQTAFEFTEHPHEGALLACPRGGFGLVAVCASRPELAHQVADAAAQPGRAGTGLPP